MNPSQDQLRSMYRTMVSIRNFEETVKQAFAKGHIPGFVHLYVGEEAIATGVCTALQPSDTITSTHRGHGHCIAKGCDLKAMMAEIYGKATGLCKGKGGSMHIADVGKGMLGANGIVGGGPPLACGAGLTSVVTGSGDVCACFFGDGACEQGSFHESANLAAIWNLPVIFVAENNGYAQSTPASYHCAIENIAERAAAYGIPGAVVDGTDVFAVHEAAVEAVKRARAGQGPSLLECKTYRHHGHFEGDQQTYKDELYMSGSQGKDPIRDFRAVVTQHDWLSAEELDAIDQEAREAVEEALAFAESSPLPRVEEVTTDVYVSYR